MSEQVDKDAERRGKGVGRPTRIWHVNIGSRRSAVDGLTFSMQRRVALERQAGFASRVAPETTPDRVLSPVRLSLEVIREMHANPPDLVHFCSGYRPYHVILGFYSRWIRRIPYVVTPASAFCETGLERDRGMKRLFIWIADRPYLRHAHAVICRTSLEALETERTLRTRLPVCVIPNSAPVDVWEHPVWSGGAPGRPKLVCLVRHDVFQKGLDRLAEVAARMPEADFVVHGAIDNNPRNHPELAQALELSSPPNFTLAAPVFGDEKLRTLSGATMYIQLSRFESLSNSVLEALAVGTPVAVSSYIGRELEVEHGPSSPVLILDDDPDRGAEQLRGALFDQARLGDLSSRGRRLAEDHFAPSTVVRQLSELYARSLRGVLPRGR